MKSTVAALVFIFFSIQIFAQDTLIVFNNYKYKVGIKLISEESGNPSISNETFPVYNIGVQIIRRIKQSKFSFESGIYYTNRAFKNTYARTYISGQTYFAHEPEYYHYLNIPVNIRFDTKLLYYSIGFYGEHFLFNSTEHEENNDSAIYIGSIRKINVGVDFIIGLEKNINTDLNFFVEARTCNNLTSFILEYSSRDYPSFVNYGFAIGINYKIPNTQVK